MYLYRRMVANRGAYIYILVVVCLFVVYFKLSFNNSSVSPLTTSSSLSRNGTERENGLIYNNVKEITGMRTRKEGSIPLVEMLKVDDVYSIDGNGNMQDFSNPKVSSENVDLQSLDNKFNEESSNRVRNKNLNPKAAIHEQQQKTPHSNSRVPMWKATKPRVLSYKHPPNEKPVKRFPQGLIIGFGKCGTRALLNFLALHPYIVHHSAEMHFYDRDETFKNGFDWYKEQMPPSYSNQVTMEKTPAYILHQRARDEIHRLTPNVKLIVLVRDPVVRLVSQFNQKHLHDDEVRVPIQSVYRKKGKGELDLRRPPVTIGIYYRYLAMWLERFPLKQFLILNAEHLSENPLPVLKRVENFLEIPPMFTERNVYFNESSGFYCPRGFEEEAIPTCLWKSKGLKHRKLPKDDEKMLYDFYRPHNEKFFQLAGKRFDWKEREWQRYH